MEVTKGLPPSDEVKSDITLQRNGPLDALPPDAMMKILSHLDVRSASRLAQSQKSMHNLRKRKFSATTEWGAFWITEHSYYEGITYEKGREWAIVASIEFRKRIAKENWRQYQNRVCPWSQSSSRQDWPDADRATLHSGKPVALDSYKAKMWVDAEEG